MIKIGINGFGRIGKLVFRLALHSPDMEIVHLNDVMPAELILHLLKYDSLHGRFLAEMKLEGNYLHCEGKKILITNEPQPSRIPWQQTGVDIVIDASGKFKTRQQLQDHLTGSVKKVILSCPPGDNSIDKIIVMGVNQQKLSAADKIISNASCTTNCAAVIMNVLKKEFGIQRMFINTVHSLTNNQNVQDGFHNDFRRARSAISNIIPTTTSAIRAIHHIFPEMQYVFDGIATRVPVADCSLVEFTAQLGRNVSVQEINDAFLKYAENELADYLEYSPDPIVSSDIKNNQHSAVFDSLSTKVLAGDLIQIIAWYDNESGYSARVIDLIKYVWKL